MHIHTHKETNTPTISSVQQPVQKMRSPIYPRTPGCMPRQKTAM